MRVFLTGGTGYVGSAVLDALVRGGHHVDALVRNSEGAAQVQARGATPCSATCCSRPRGATRPRRPTARFTRRREYGPRAAKSTRPRSTARRAAAEAESLPHLHLGHLGARAGAGAGRRDRAAEPVEIGRGARARTADARHGAAGVRARSSCGPGIVYGGSRGIVGDLLKDAANSLVRIVGSGENHWPLIYDRDLGDLYARMVARLGRRSSMRPTGATRR